MKHVFIINTQSDRRKQERLKQEILVNFSQEEVIIAYTRYKGHAGILARQYAQAKETMRIYACGGDGTLHEVLNGILDFPHIQLGVIPIGTGNDFIKAFPTLSQEDFLDLNNYKNAHCIQIDCIMIDDQASINTVSAGLDVHVTYHVDKFKHLPFLNGSLPYYFGLLVSMANKIYETFTLRIDENQPITDEYLFVVIGNGRCYGGGYRPTPNAKIDDGWLDYSLIRKVSRRKILMLSKKYKKGSHTEYKDLVQSGRLKCMKIHTKGQPIRLNLDGELYEARDPYIYIKEKSVLFAVPAIEKNQLQNCYNEQLVVNNEKRRKELCI